MRSIIVGVTILILGGAFLYYKNNTYPTPSPLPTNRNIEISATFKIITNGTTRIFTDKKYHNLSNDVFITSQSPNTIQVKKDGITWSDFFDTLPMNLDKNCLVTGTGQKFCTNSVNSLTFIINGTEDPNILNKEILDGDYLLVEYK